MLPRWGTIPGMADKWLDEMIRNRPSDWARLAKSAGRWPNRKREIWTTRLVVQLLANPYRDAVVSVHTSIDGAKMSRRRMLKRPPWSGLSDVRIYTRRVGGGFAIIAAAYQPDLLAEETESHV